MNARDYQLYPIELSLSSVKKAWGGWPGKIGEVWSLSGHPHESIALNGALAGQSLTKIVGNFQQKLLGRNIELDPREPFPFLLKFISTAKNIPVQVHPDDAYTLEQGLPMVGRDKICYILNAKPDAHLYLGFKNRVDGNVVREAIHNRTLRHLMNSLAVKPGDLFTIPAGRIHSFGKGVIFFEIQRHSSLTFRLSNWDKEEVKEECVSPPQLDEILQFLDLNPNSPKPIQKARIPSEKNSVEWVGLTPNFAIRRLSIKEPLELALAGNRFMVYTGLLGTGWLRWGITDISIFIQPLQSILVPAMPEDICFESEEGLEMLEISVPDLAGETMEEIIRAGIPSERIKGLGGEDYGMILKEYI